MAEEVKGTNEEVVVITEVPEAAKPQNLLPPPDTPVHAPPPAAEEEEEPPHTKTVVDDNPTPTAPADHDDNKPNDVVPEKKESKPKPHEFQLPDHELKALAELKLLIQDALSKHEFSSSPAPPPPAVEDPKEEQSTANDEVKEKEEEEKQEEAVQTVVVSNVDEDGTRTVEAIEETVVSVVPSSTPQEETETAQQHQSPPACSPPPAVADHQQQKQEESTEAKETIVVSSPPAPEEVSIWGVPLLKDERSDTVLWKFLRARDFKAKEAFTMIKNTIKWRKEFKIDELLEEEFDDDEETMRRATFMHGLSKEGHPVCYNVYGAFQDKEVYNKTFSDEEKRQRFLRWRVQLLEKSIRKLDFYPGGVSTIVHVNDLKNSPGPGKWELRQATKQALLLFQDNYPEFVAKQVFINVPWWYMAVNKMISPFLTQRTKSKFVVAGPSKSAETLFNYIAPEQVPIQYGGLSRSEGEFCAKDGATQIIVKPSSKESVEFAVTEACYLTWEVRVVGWEVSYGAEFVPNAKDGHTVIIQKIRKVGPTEETIITNTFKTSEPGKVVLTLHNSSSKKKRLLYRLKSNPSFDS